MQDKYSEAGCEINVVMRERGGWCLGGHANLGAMGKKGNSSLNAQLSLSPLCTQSQVERGKGRPIPTPPPIYTARERLWHSKSYQRRRKWNKVS